MKSWPIYTGVRRKLILALDVGTTCSGVSYCILDPGTHPVVQSVTRFPAQEGIGGDCKIPTIILYGPDCDVRAVGAEAEQESFLEMIETDHLVKAEWFKLHLRPKEMKYPQAIKDIPPLPPGKSIQTVFADFLKYLFDCSKKFITESHMNGGSIWNPERIVILSRPNGWEWAQQALMRRAAVQAGLVPDTEEGRDSVQFATGGEASLHYCLSHGLLANQLKKGDAILIVDAGGGTIDITGYTKSGELTFEEAAVPQCHLQGSVLVTRRAREFLQNFLMGSKYHDAVDEIAKSFDKSAKLRFRDINETTFIKFGSMRDKDPDFNIRTGQLRLEGEVVAHFFAPSISCITNTVTEAKFLSQIKAVFLVGGFAGSEWLFTSLKDKLQQYSNISLLRPDHHSSKAVADGAVSFYLDHFVHARISRYVYGVKCNLDYNRYDPEHLRRQDTAYIEADGVVRVPGAFDIVLPKDTIVGESQEFRRNFNICDYEKKNLMKCDLRTTIHCYRGSLKQPQWTTDGSPMDRKEMCTIVAGKSSLNQVIKKKWNSKINCHYYEVSYDVILLLGPSELKAQICWKDSNGKERRFC